MSVGISPTPILQFFDNRGQVAVGGSVLTQVSGVNQATYQDSAGNTPLPNPVPLNSRGEVSNASGVSCQMFLTLGFAYTFTLFDRDGNQLNQPSYVTASVSGAQLIATTGAGLVGLSHDVTYPDATVGQKLNQSVLVTDAPYNAVGDGITDDWPAFAAAIADVGTDGEVLVPGNSDENYYLGSCPGLIIGASTGAARLIGLGMPTLTMNSIGSTVDCVNLLGNNYRRMEFRNFVIDCNRTGRDGVSISAGDFPYVDNIRVFDSARDGFALTPQLGSDWIENGLFRRVKVEDCGRHGITLRLTGNNSGAVGTAQQYITESVFQDCEVRGVAQVVTGAYGIFAESLTSWAGAQISDIKLDVVNIDGDSAAAVAAGNALGNNPMRIKYNAGAVNVFSSWVIGPCGWETTTSPNISGVGLIWAEKNVTAKGWVIGAITPSGWPTGGGYVGLADYTISDKQTGAFVTRDSGFSGGLKVMAASNTYDVDIPFRILPLFGAAYMNSGTPTSGADNDFGALAAPAMMYEFCIAYQRTSGLDKEYYSSQFVVNAYWLGASVTTFAVSAINILVDTTGTMITINSVTPDPANNRVRVNVTTGASYGSGGGSVASLFMLEAKGLCRDTL